MTSEDIIRMARAAGFSEKQWLAMTYDSGPYDVTKPTTALISFAALVAAAERERICKAIKEEDDHCADGDYMMDSDDCIMVVRGTWNRPDWGTP